MMIATNQISLIIAVCMLVGCLGCDRSGTQTMQGEQITDDGQASGDGFVMKYTMDIKCGDPAEIHSFKQSLLRTDDVVESDNFTTFEEVDHFIGEALGTDVREDEFVSRSHFGR